MTNEEIEKLRGYYDSLMEQKWMLDGLAQKGHLTLGSRQFQVIAEELRRIESDFPGLLPQFKDSEFFKNQTTYDLGAFRSYIATAVSRLKARLSSLTEISIPMRVTREGVFFAGQFYDALQRIAEILSQATQSILLIDGYIDEKVLNLVTNTTLSVWLVGPKMLRQHALTPVLPNTTNAVFQGFLTECDCLKFPAPEISPLKINNLVTLTK
jgi:hypothetical protein